MLQEILVSIRQPSASRLGCRSSCSLRPHSSTDLNASPGTQAFLSIISEPQRPTSVSLPFASCSLSSGFERLVCAVSCRSMQEAGPVGARSRSINDTRFTVPSSRICFRDEHSAAARGDFPFLGDTSTLCSITVSIKQRFESITRSSGRCCGAMGRAA